MYQGKKRFVPSDITLRSNSSILQTSRDNAAQLLTMQVLDDSMVSIKIFFWKYIFIQLFTDFNKASYKVQYAENNLKKILSQNQHAWRFGKCYLLKWRLCQAGQVILSYTASWTYFRNNYAKTPIENTSLHTFQFL